MRKSIRYLLILSLFSFAAEASRHRSASPTGGAQRLNFYKEFCPRIESNCKRGIDENGRCLAPFVNIAELKKKVRNRHFLLVTGLGGDVQDRNDYYDKTTKRALEYLGLPRVRVEKFVEPSRTSSEEAASNLCLKVAQITERLAFNDEEYNKRGTSKVVIIAHSKGGRVLLRAAFQACPHLMGSELVEGMLGVQAAIGPSPLANWQEQFDNSRWADAKACDKTSRYPQWLLTKGGLALSELGQHVDDVAGGRIAYDSCPSCNRKFFFVTSSWDREACDSSRVFGHDTGCFVGARDGRNDLRLPVTSQSTDRAGKIIANVACAAHSDFFKTRHLPNGNGPCQMAFNLWLLQTMYQNLR